MKNIILLTAVLAVFGAGQAKADLFDLTNPPYQSNTPIALSFVAGAATTDIIFGGYDAFGEVIASDISLTTGGGGNLLGQTWNFTPTPFDSIADQTPDGSELDFSAGDNLFDEFDQEIGTVIGQTYDINFLLSRFNIGGPDGADDAFFVDASDATLVTPEPGSLILLAFCISGGAVVARKKLAR